MIKGEFLQLAQEYGMKQDQGVAYGIVDGYAATFTDGAGTHRMMLTTRFASNTDKDALMEIINRTDLKGLYNIRKLQIAKKVVYVAFAMAPDTMKKIRSFIEWFFPLLEQFGASKADICVQCQEPMEDKDAQWILRDGATAFRVHKPCADELKLTIKTQTKGYRADQNGSIGMGILGALAGAGVGIALWLILKLINFYGPIAGMATGWLSLFFYGRFHGKASKLRIPILVIAGILSTILGAASSAVLEILLKGGGAQSVSLFLSAFQADPAFQEGVLFNIGIGIFLMGLGLFASVKSEGRRTTDFVITDLN